jgi:uncharacterized protein YutE (UPF0331/DUF86 family)
MTRSTLTTADLTLLIKKMSEAQDKAIRDFTNQWSKLGVVGLFHTKDTNAYTLQFKDRHNLEKALPKIEKNPNVSLYYTKPDHLKEVSNAIENLDYFKAFTLCVTLYESYGKDILISQFKDKPSLAQDITNKLLVSNIIDLLYKHGMIEKGVRSQMESVNKTRNDFTHRYFSSQISIELANRIKDNIPKIMKTLVTLKGIYDKFPKE